MKAIEMRTNSYGLTEDFDNKHSFGRERTDKELGLKPNTGYAVVAIELPTGTRLVTDEEKQKYKKPKDYYIYFGDKFEKTRGSDGKWWDDTVYAIPINHEWEEDKQHVDVTVTMNGKPVDPSTLPEETWNKLREGK